MQETAYEFEPRNYQLDFLEKSKSRNIIVPLGTGTGKTFIAVMLMKEYADQVQIAYSEGGKRIVFLVETVLLVGQQAEQIRRSGFKVGQYHGSKNVDNLTDDETRKTELDSNQVLVFTAQVFWEMLNHGYFSLDRTCLLVFDECHHTKKNSPFFQITKQYREIPIDNRPRVLGLTASLVGRKIKPTEFEHEIYNLEKALDCTVEGISDWSSVSKFGSKAQVVVITCKNFEISKLGLCSETNDWIQMLANFCENADVDPQLELDPRVAANEALKRMKDILTQLGPWSLSLVYHVWMKQLSRIRESAVIDDLEVYCDLGFSRLQAIGALLRSHIKVVSSIDETLPFIPDKVARLLDILRQYSGEEAARHFSCIIFVEQRAVAFALKVLLTEIKSLDSGNFGFLNVDWVIGQGGVAYGSSDEKRISLSRRQEEVLKDFREKRLNLLVCTRVLEEGVDIRQCNVVIRFDKPKEYQSYIQSKGRARKPGSKYFILIEERECESFSEDLKNYVKFEKLFAEYLLRRGVPNNNEEPINVCDSEEEIFSPEPPSDVYLESKPKITSHTAIPIVYRYCAKLPGDAFSLRTPKIDFEEIAVEDTICYKCSVTLPLNSPVKKTIEGKANSSKKRAQMSAAFEVCKELHKFGELDHHLYPVGRETKAYKRLLDILGPETTEQCSEDVRPGTSKRKQIYDKKIPTVFEDYIQCNGYVHLIILKRNDHSVYDSSFGLFSSKPIPKIPCFPLFTRENRLTVTLGVSVPVQFTYDEMTSISQFHECVFSNILGLRGNFMKYDPSNGAFNAYIIPYSPDSDVGRRNLVPNWELILETLDNLLKIPRIPADSERKVFEFDRSKYEDAIVVPWYRRVSCQRLYSVAAICDKVNASSHFPQNYNPKGYTTFNDYYKKCYDLTIFNQLQPLLVAELLKDRLNCLFSIIGRNQAKRRKYLPKLVPELVDVFPISLIVRNALLTLPSILYRLVGLLNANELRKTVELEAFKRSGDLTVDYEWDTLNYELEQETEETQPYNPEIGPLDSEQNSTIEVMEENESNDDKNKFDEEDLDQLYFELQFDGFLKPKASSASAGDDETNDDQLVETENSSLEVEFDNLTVDVQTNSNGELEKKPEFKSMPSMELDSINSNKFGPSPCLLLQALTTTGASDGFNLERLETIGDSFLKYSTTVNLFHADTDINEGSLTLLRTNQISNARLYTLAKAKGIPEIMVTSGFDPRHQWLPPGFIHVESYETEQQADEDSDLEDDFDVSKMDYHRLTEQSISDKSVADATEALIGCYLLTYGNKGALEFMKWLGLKSLPEHIVQPLLDTSQNGIDMLNSMWEKNNFGMSSNGLEQKLGYQFKNRAFLVQALTHTTYSANRVTDCYQRLEFLGDAVLDYLITQYLYQDKRKYSPGVLTDLRSALVNNTIFAWLTVHYGFNDHFLHSSPTLFSAIDNYIKSVKQHGDNVVNFNNDLRLVTEDDTNGESLEEVEVPKALGDIFESLVGAVFLDCERSLDKTWSVFYHFMKKTIECCCENLPKSPIRELNEIFPPGLLKYSKTEEGGKIKVTLKVSGKGRFEGYGRNGSLAKLAAVKRALKHLKDL